jgi:hypothetical protein
MKKIIFSFILLGFAIFLNAQTVDSIKVEQAGELIKIHYKILNSNQYQTFRVTVFCSINGGLESKLKSLSGDFGENVVGGRNEYMVLWDVLKDVEEVKSVDFSVRAELLKDETPVSELKKDMSKWSGGMVYILPAYGNGHGTYFGLRAGYMGRWGIYAKFVAGKEDFDNTDVYKPVFHISLDLTKRIVNSGPFQMHILAGVAYGKLMVGQFDESSYFGNFPTYEFGAIIAVGPVSYSMAFQPYNPTVEHPFFRKNFMDIALGIRF